MSWKTTRVQSNTGIRTRAVETTTLPQPEALLSHLQLFFTINHPSVHSSKLNPAWSNRTRHEWRGLKFLEIYESLKKRNKKILSGDRNAHNSKMADSGRRRALLETLERRKPRISETFRVAFCRETRAYSAYQFSSELRGTRSMRRVLELWSRTKSLNHDAPKISPRFRPIFETSIFASSSQYTPHQLNTASLAHSAQAKRQQRDVVFTVQSLNSDILSRWTQRTPIW